MEGQRREEIGRRPAGRGPQQARDQRVERSDLRAVSGSDARRGVDGGRYSIRGWLCVS
jgi:hypothetical protein